MAKHRAKQANAYPVTVNYGLSVRNALKSAHFDWVKIPPDNHFPTDRKGKVEVVVELFQFKRLISADEVLDKLDRMGYRPADIRELIAFSKKYAKESQDEYPPKFPVVVGLGSCLENSHEGYYTPYLDNITCFRRGLGMRWFRENECGCSLWFAAVHK